MGEEGREARQEMTEQSSPGEALGGCRNSGKNWTVVSGSTGWECLESGLFEVTHWLVV